MTRPAPTLPEPFRIGVRPLGEAPWLIVDAALGTRLDEKTRLVAERPEAVLGALPGSAAGARAARAAIERWLLARATATHAARDAADGAGAVRVRGRPPPDPALPPLAAAALLVAEDLVLLHRDAAGWIVAAGCVAFPSAWSLGEKLGRPLGAVHAPVPGYAEGTQADRLITRMLDALRPGQPVLRGNWSLHAEPVLHLPRHTDDHAERLAATPPEALWLRRERQTLARLAATGDVLFTIHTSLEPLAALDTDTRAVLERQLAALDPAQRAYRGLPQRTETSITSRSGTSS